LVISSINGQKANFAQVNYAADQKRVTSGIVKILVVKGSRAPNITANAICPGYYPQRIWWNGRAGKKCAISIVAQNSDRPLGRPGGDRQRACIPCQR